MEINYLKQCLAHDKNTGSVSNNFLCVRDPYNADTLHISLTYSTYFSYIDHLNHLNLSFLNCKMRIIESMSDKYLGD